jgi:hypothetical protein
MRLPDGADAVVDVSKLRDYCLSPSHLRGRHKARAFSSALGLTQADAEFLRRRLLDVAREEEAVKGSTDEYGERYTIDFELVSGVRRARVRSAWIVRRSEAFPRLTTCYVLLDWSLVMTEIDLLSVVALLEDMPVKGLRRGQVGTVVEALGPGVWEVEFSDDSGQTYASIPLRAEQLMRLHHRAEHPAA